MLPRDKHDLQRANAAIEVGYPAVAPILPHLLIWLQDLNWPVSRILAPFLATIGQPLIPEIRCILQGDDEIWTYGVLYAVVSNMPLDCMEELRIDLELLASNPSEEDVDAIAAELLAKLPTVLE